ncbi:portal protein [Microbacterium phage Schubert]|uniref:Portal protein n=1 Tax=Microbacterium phage Schubert TaxID=2500787 RepID=A0A3Q9RAB8_9CAUD|nr:portal protein [Microbacterium phage Schubert]AZV01710.1 portal protein [Microbacterium phage Schubert]
MADIKTYLLGKNSQTFAPYYNGKMSYTLHGKEWEKYVSEAFPDIKDQQTSENIFKAVIDLYAENLVPVPDELRGFSNVLVPLLSRGECPVVVDSAGTPHFPEHYEMISDGRYTAAAIFTRSLEKMEDYCTFVFSDGTSELWAKPVPDDLSSPDRKGYKYVETTHGHTLFRFALDDKGFGASLAALQDRINHSILDQTVVAEMYARPFWYLLNVELPPENPYLPKQAETGQATMKEQRTNGASGRIFTTSSEGPFGQLEPPTIQDMIAYHDSILDKVSQSTGIPQHYFKPGQGTPPTGVALKVLSRRFNNKIARIREDIEPQLEELATLLGVERTVEVEGKTEKEFQFWPESDDLLQEAMDAHGIALSQMGYPLDYIATVVTPGVDLDDYMDDGFQEAAMTPDQVAAYAANPGQRAGQPAINTPPNAQQAASN